MRPLPNSVSTPEAADIRWFREEVEVHEPRLRAYLRTQFPQLHDVDDVVQESYMALLRRRMAGDVRSARGLLFTAARNLALDLFRRGRSSPIAAVPLDNAPPAADERRSAADELCLQQELSLLAEAVGSLPRRTREVLKLRKIYGLTHREIAEHLGLSERTVNAEVMKGMRLCSAFLRARGVPPLANRSST